MRLSLELHVFLMLLLRLRYFFVAWTCFFVFYAVLNGFYDFSERSTELAKNHFSNKYKVIKTFDMIENRTH